MVEDDTASHSQDTGYHQHFHVTFSTTTIATTKLLKAMVSGWKSPLSHLYHFSGTLACLLEIAFRCRRV